MRLLHLLHAAGLFLAFPLHAGVLINEIMYHPVERPAFDAAGDPVLLLVPPQEIILHESTDHPLSMQTPLEHPITS